MREELLELLADIDDSINYEVETALIDDRLLDSIAVISLVAELEDTFDISVGPSDIIPDNFNSLDAMLELVQRLKEN
ncbi:MAG: acyl carrier protein [Lachnospiraceae bacterium]|nr:acyl carrier protein [Candidatus Equihabitans merdae]